MASESEVSAFAGLANVNDPVRVGLRGLVTADNVEVDATGALRKRLGRDLVTPGMFVSGYATDDGSACYLQQVDGIYRLREDESLTLVTPLESAAPVLWCELNGKVYFAHESHDGVLTHDSVLPLRWERPAPPALTAGAGALAGGQYQAAVTHVLPDGRETGASARTAITVAAGAGITMTVAPPPPGWAARVYLSAADSTSLLLLGETTGAPLHFDSNPNRLGKELLTEHTMALPTGARALAAWHGRVWCATLSDDGQHSVVWASLPLAPHLWGMTEGFFAVPGGVTLLADGGDALLVGTGDAIYAVRQTDAGPLLEPLADYGVVPGDACAKDGATRYLWTKRGVCRYPDFTNLTERRVSVPPGSVANAAVVHDRGQVRFLACLAAGGHAFNPHQ